MSDHNVHSYMVSIAVKDMAANLERKWRSQFVFMQDQVIHVDDDPQGGLYHRHFMMGLLSSLCFLISARRETKEAQTP